MPEESVARETPGEIVFFATPTVLAAFEAQKIFLGRPGAVRPDERITFPKTISVEPYSGFPARDLFECGAFSYSESGGELARLKVGRYCSIARGLQVLGVRHPIEWVTSSSLTYDFIGGLGYSAFTAAHADLLGNAFPQNIPVTLEQPYPTIEHDVWIGQNVQLARGIRIGTGSVVAAGSIVTRDVEPYTVVGGAPARVIRRRFPEEISARLLAARWWRYHPRHLFELGFTDPGLFLDRFEQEAAEERLVPYQPARVTWRDVASVLAHRETIEADRLFDEGMLREGWSEREKGFVWAVGPSSVVALPAAAIGPFKSLDLELTITPFRAQRVTVSARTPQGQRPVANMLLTGGSLVPVRLTPDMIVDGEIVLEIEHPDFCRPVDFGYNEDVREVSVAIHRIVLH